jgi:hypothetical protein
LRNILSWFQLADALSRSRSFDNNFQSFLLTDRRKMDRRP